MGVEAAADALEGLGVVEWLRMSRWGYAGVSGVHVFGIALLVGAIVPLNLRLLGVWRSVELGALYRVLARFAATGLGLAALSGALLFSIRAGEYADLGLFRAKLVLIAVGAAHALVLHFATRFPAVPRAGQVAAGAVSLLLWPAVLVCGRLLAFV